MSEITLRSTKGALLTNQEIDDNFSNLNTDKYEAGDDIVANNLTATGSMSYSSAQISAAGTTWTDATELTTTYSVVNTATASQGVKLPYASAGANFIIVNDTNVNIIVYPNNQDAIDDNAVEQGGGEGAVVLKSGVTMTLIATSTSLWRTFLTNSVQVFNAAGVRLA